MVQVQDVTKEPDLRSGSGRGDGVVFAHLFAARHRARRANHRMGRGWCLVVIAAGRASATSGTRSA